jgi:hypothetical protein
MILVPMLPFYQSHPIKYKLKILNMSVYERVHISSTEFVYNSTHFSYVERLTHTCELDNYVEEWRQRDPTTL